MSYRVQRGMAWRAHDFVGAGVPGEGGDGCAGEQRGGTAGVGRERLRRPDAHHSVAVRCRHVLAARRKRRRHHRRVMPCQLLCLWVKLQTLSSLPLKYLSTCVGLGAGGKDTEGGQKSNSITVSLDAGQPSLQDLQS